MKDNVFDNTKEENRCKFCGCYMEYVDNSYLSEGGWCEDEGFVCNNKNCKGERDEYFAKKNKII